MLPFFYANDEIKYVLTEGNDIQLSCQLLYGYETNQDVTLNWLFNGKLLNNKADKFVISKTIQKKTNSYKMFLQIKQIQFAEMGSYQCQAINTYGNKSNTIVIKVKSKLFFFVTH